jgi:hypothetical protein
MFKLIMWLNYFLIMEGNHPNGKLFWFRGKKNLLFLICYRLHKVVIDYCPWSSDVATQILGNKNCLDNSITFYGDHIIPPIMDHLASHNHGRPNSMEYMGSTALLLMTMKVTMYGMPWILILILGTIPNGLLN